MAGTVMAHKFNQSKFDDRKAKLQAAKNAVVTLNQIIANVEGSNITQSQTAIKNIATHQKALIRIVAGEVI